MFISLTAIEDGEGKAFLDITKEGMAFGKMYKINARQL